VRAFGSTTNDTRAALRVHELEFQFSTQIRAHVRSDLQATEPRCKAVNRKSITLVEGNIDSIAASIACQHQSAGLELTMAARCIVACGHTDSE